MHSKIQEEALLKILLTCLLLLAAIGRSAQAEPPPPGSLLSHKYPVIWCNDLDIIKQYVSLRQSSGIGKATDFWLAKASQIPHPSCGLATLMTVQLGENRYLGDATGYSIWAVKIIVPDNGVWFIWEKRSMKNPEI